MLRTPYLYTNNVWSNAYIIDIVLKTGKVPLQVMQHPENAHVSWPFHYYVEAIICRLTGLSAFFVEKWIGNILFGPLILVLFYFIGKEFKLNEEERLKTVLFIGIIASFYNNIYSHSTNIPEFLMVSMFYFALKKNLLSKLLVLLFGVLLMNTHPLTFIFSFFFIIPVIYSDVKKKNFLFLSYLIPLLFALDFFWFHTIYPFMFKNIKAMLEALNLENLIPFYEIIFFMCLIFGLLLLYLLCEVINRINIKFKKNIKKSVFIFSILILIILYLFNFKVIPNYYFKEIPLKYFFSLYFSFFYFLKELEKIQKKTLFQIFTFFILFAFFSVLVPFGDRLDAIRTIAYAMLPLSFLIGPFVKLKNKKVMALILFLCFFSTHPNFVFGFNTKNTEAYGFVNFYDVLSSEWVGMNSNPRDRIITDTTLSGLVLFYGNRSASWDKSYKILVNGNTSYFEEKMMTFINSPAIFSNTIIGDDYHHVGGKFLLISDRMKEFGVVHGYGLPTKPLSIDLNQDFLDKIYVNNKDEIYQNNKI